MSSLSRSMFRWAAALVILCCAAATVFFDNSTLRTSAVAQSKPFPKGALRAAESPDPIMRMLHDRYSVQHCNRNAGCPVEVISDTANARNDLAGHTESLLRRRLRFIYRSYPTKPADILVEMDIADFRSGFHPPASFFFTDIGATGELREYRLVLSSTGQELSCWSSIKDRPCPEPKLGPGELDKARDTYRRLLNNMDTIQLIKVN